MGEREGKEKISNNNNNKLGNEIITMWHGHEHGGVAAVCIIIIAIAIITTTLPFLTLRLFIIPHPCLDQPSFHFFSPGNSSRGSAHFSPFHPLIPIYFFCMLPLPPTHFSSTSPFLSLTGAHTHTHRLIVAKQGDIGETVQ
uniref:Uncharacterized protein n=1 Tax=Trypanosoma vivax (strain Y486) TaxID=1055687 RepID=G0UD61_TRYVY|nr:hypothetical protein, unlikely [Trypanosoma vivax Y486]